MSDRRVIEFPEPRHDWVPVEDDGCRWILDLEGEPFAVLPCDVCMSPVEIFTHEVRCPQRGKHTPEVISGRLIDVLELWNEIVSSNEEESGTDTTRLVR